LEHEQFVVVMPDHPDDLAVPEAHPLDASEFHFAARRRNALEFPLMRAPDGVKRTITSPSSASISSTVK
jgi:hypothetical protein